MQNPSVLLKVIQSVRFVAIASVYAVSFCSIKLTEDSPKATNYLRVLTLYKELGSGSRNKSPPDVMLNRVSKLPVKD